MVAAIGSCVLVIFIISPTILLILYPTKLFRKCVSCCGFRRWHALHMFVESFQGEYKDGTNGTHDFRMVSASFLILRILILATFHNFILWFSAGKQFALLIGAACFYAIVRPYKMNFRNIVDILILTVLEALSAVILVLAYRPPTKETATIYVLATTLPLLIPHMVLTVYICYVLAKKAGFTECLVRKLKTLKRLVKRYTVHELKQTWKLRQILAHCQTG